MKEDIVSKKILRELSNLPINTEARVVYLLIQIRKVLDHINRKTGALRFYCDWVAHVNLNRSFASLVYDEVANNSKNGLDIISFRKLRSEMEVFFNEHNLPLDLLDEENWTIFRDNLIEILVDTPIQKVDEIVVGELVFRKVDDRVKFSFVSENEGISVELGDIL
jgi:hypothetical protein